MNRLDSASPRCLSSSVPLEPNRWGVRGYLMKSPCEAPIAAVLVRAHQQKHPCGTAAGVFILLNFHLSQSKNATELDRVSVLPTTRSPRRPNLIALTLCKVVAVKDNVIEIDKTDAFDGTPVLDIKPFLPGYDSVEDARVPDWAKSK